MHIHGNSMQLNGPDFYSVSAAEKAATAQRAAETRKKLMMKAQGLEDGFTPDESQLISRWLNPQQSPLGPPK